MKIELQNINCPNCGSSNFRKYKTLSNSINYSNLPSLKNLFFNAVKCCECRLVYINPVIPKDFNKEIYKYSLFENYKKIDRYNNVRSRGHEIYMKDLDFRSGQFEGIANVLKQFKQEPGKLLDIGCSFGHLLQIAGKYGWQTNGIDISEEGTSYAKNKLNLDVINDELQNHPFSASSFDAITALEFIEHSQELSKDLTIIHRLLKDNGILIIKVPNLKSIKAKIYQSKWQCWEPVEHLTYFKRQTLNNTLKNHGFSPISFINLKTINTYLKPIKHSIIKKIIHTMLYVFDMHDTLLVVCKKELR